MNGICYNVNSTPIQIADQQLSYLMYILQILKNVFCRKKVIK